MSHFLRQLVFVSLLCAPLFVAACRQHLPMTTTVMRYEDFGPPSMVYELIGFDWWQWQPHVPARAGRVSLSHACHVELVAARAGAMPRHAVAS
jgi:hypothetical protein